MYFVVGCGNIKLTVNENSLTDYCPGLILPLGHALHYIFAYYHREVRSCRQYTYRIFWVKCIFVFKQENTIFIWDLILRFKSFLFSHSIQWYIIHMIIRVRNKVSGYHYFIVYVRNHHKQWVNIHFMSIHIFCWSTISVRTQTTEIKILDLHSIIYNQYNIINHARYQSLYHNAGIHVTCPSSPRVSEKTTALEAS